MNSFWYLILSTALAQNVVDDEQVLYTDTVGSWTIAGDPSINACVMWGQNDGRTRLGVLANPAYNELTFSLKNEAWMSLESKQVTVQAVFFDRSMEVTDFWSLDSVGIAHDQGGPILQFTIDRAKNDGVSFMDNFRSSSRVVFAIDEVPIADFSLENSSRALASLTTCRSTLRADDNFDPFRK